MKIQINAAARLMATRKHTTRNQIRLNGDQSSKGGWRRI